jgi:hypothetical protein
MRDMGIKIDQSQSMSETGATSLDSGPTNESMPDRPRYLVKTRGRWRFNPSEAMKARGFYYITFGSILTRSDIDRVIGLNAEWDEMRKGTASKREVARPGRTLAWGYQKIMAVRRQEREEIGRPITPHEAKWSDWARFWHHAGPKFGHRDPRTITSDELLTFRSEIANKHGAHAAWTTIKTWRALWSRMSAIKCLDGEPLCGAATKTNGDPSKMWTYGNPQPKGRTQTWRADEVSTLVSAAWENAFRGLACAIAVAWDTQFSPIDVCSLTLAQLLPDGYGGLYFKSARAKTGEAACGTLSPKTIELLQRYMTGRTAEFMDHVPMFWARGSAIIRPHTLHQGQANGRL